MSHPAGDWYQYPDGPEAEPDCCPECGTTDPPEPFRSRYEHGAYCPTKGCTWAAVDLTPEGEAEERRMIEEAHQAELRAMQHEHEAALRAWAWHRLADDCPGDELYAFADGHGRVLATYRCCSRGSGFDGYLDAWPWSSLFPPPPETVDASDWDDDEQLPF